MQSALFDRQDLKRRPIFFALGVIVFIAAYSTGAALPMTQQEAELVTEEFTERIEGIDSAGIFENNILAALGMFVPGFGVGLGIYAGVSTGMVFNAFAIVYPSLEGVSPLSVLATPFGILEVFAYGLAISRSGILVHHFIKKKPWRQYIVITLIEIGVALAALLIGAQIEGQVIQDVDSTT
ncbi:MAG TPA: stage II sporulation protein M [Nitrososphaera sp.]